MGGESQGEALQKLLGEAEHVNLDAGVESLKKKDFKSVSWLQPVDFKG